MDILNRALQINCFRRNAIMFSKDSSALHIPVPACKTVLIDISSLRYVYHFTFHVQICALLPPAKRSLGQGNIFAPVCHSVHRGRVPGQVHPTAGTPPGQVHPRAGAPPGQVHPQAGTPHWAGTPPG